MGFISFGRTCSTKSRIAKIISALDSTSRKFCTITSSCISGQICYRCWNISNSPVPPSAACRRIWIIHSYGKAFGAFWSTRPVNEGDVLPLTPKSRKYMRRCKLLSCFYFITSDLKCCGLRRKCYECQYTWNDKFFIKTSLLWPIFILFDVHWSHYAKGAMIAQMQS